MDLPPTHQHQGQTATGDKLKWGEGLMHDPAEKYTPGRTHDQSRLLEHIDGLPTKCMTSDRSLGKRRAESSGGDPGPGPGPDGRFGRGGGVSGHAAASLEIPCSLVMPLGRHQHAPQSLGWERVCGTEKSGVWVLKGATRTYNLPRNLDDVGIVWEHRSGYETAWATPGHVCSCSYDYGRGPVLPQANTSVFTEAVNLWSRVASLLTPWCAKGEVPTGVNLNRYAGNGSFIPWHCDNEPLFGSPFERRSSSV